MSINPSKTGSALNNPTQRANDINDPQFSEQQGYFPYDLTHGEYITPRFGEVTPSMCLHTVPGDRIVHRDNTKTVLNQINGNFLSTVNQYVDTFFVPMRSLYPTNYAKLFPNPTKGDDLPNSALPQFPISLFIYNFINSTDEVNFFGSAVEGEEINVANSTAMSSLADPTIDFYRISRYTLLATMLSRGQLLDYLGCQFDNATGYNERIKLQDSIDEYFDVFYGRVIANIEQSIEVEGYYIPIRPGSAYINVNLDRKSEKITDLSTLREFISTAFERGDYFYLTLDGTPFIFGDDDFLQDFKTNLSRIFSISNTVNTVAEINSSADPFRFGFINIAPCLAYQQIIAQYYSNNTVDNIFTSDLFMQLLRSVMFPPDPDTNGSYEPTFTYNGVTTEYDYISPGAVIPSLIDVYSGRNYYPLGAPHRSYLFATLMFLMRRSLRYGDYFSTARPNMLAVGQLSIPVGDGNTVSPIDVTKNLLMQRYMNAANYIGSGELPYFASIYGVTPSDTGTYPRFVSHRKIELKNDIVTNTANDQGYQKTNLVGFSDQNGFDVFIDDFGIILSLQSYDVLPVYDSGIDNTFHLSDRFDYFNPMLQNIGDQPIFLSEFIGLPDLHSSIFGYTMRNAEYKFKLSRAHGGFVSSLPGFLLKFPLDLYEDETDGDIVISPDFIRDKPSYFDSVLPQQTGTSPANYYHFVVACLNQLNAARKIQATPPVLF